MLDKIFVRRKIGLIQRDLVRLEEFKDKTFDEVAKDWRDFAVVKNLLMEIIGRGIDINQHILAEKFTPAISAPLDYTETFLKLSEIGVLPGDFTREIAKSASFRNAIVHGYNRIDKSIVFQTVGMAIEQYTKYCGYVQKFLEKEAENPQSHSAGFTRSSSPSLRVEDRVGGFTLIEILVVIAVLIITLAGGVLVWQRQTAPTATPPSTITPTPEFESSHTDKLVYKADRDICGEIVFVEKLGEDLDSALKKITTQKKEEFTRWCPDNPCHDVIIETKKAQEVRDLNNSLVDVDLYFILVKDKNTNLKVHAISEAIDADGNLYSLSWCPD